MKVAKRQAVVIPVTKKVKVSRVCKLPDCKNLAYGPRIFCSVVCRNEGQSKKHRLINTGRPTLYRPEFATTVMDAYIEECYAVEERLVATESSFLVLKRAKMPSHEGFALFLNKEHKVRIHTKALYDWSLAHEDFALALDILTMVQKQYVIDNSGAGLISPVATKLILSTNHGMVERSEVDNHHKYLGIVKHLYARADEMEREALPPPHG